MCLLWVSMVSRSVEEAGCWCMSSRLFWWSRSCFLKGQLSNSRTKYNPLLVQHGEQKERPTSTKVWRSGLVGSVSYRLGWFLYIGKIRDIRSWTVLRQFSKSANFLWNSQVTCWVGSELFICLTQSRTTCRPTMSALSEGCNFRCIVNFSAKT